MEAVRHVLNSPTYHEMMKREAMHLFEHALTKAVRKLDSLVHGERTKDADRIAASTAISRIYDVVRKPGGTPPQSPAEKALEDWERRNKVGVTITP